jgi:hypothetical protein
VLSELTQEKLKEVLHYDQDTGIFTWKIDFATLRKGKEAGTCKPSGYRDIQYKGKIYKTHRLAWLYIHGVFPNEYIHHANGVRDDNRISNLRDVSRRENNQNGRKQRAGKLLGTHYFKREGKWYSLIRVGGRQVHLGYFSTEKEANDKYAEALNYLDKTEWFNQFKRKPAKGYHWDTRAKKWRARIEYKNKKYNLGHFDSTEEAHAAYLKAKEALANEAK